MKRRLLQPSWSSKAYIMHPAFNKASYHLRCWPFLVIVGLKLFRTRVQAPPGGGQTISSQGTNACKRTHGRHKRSNYGVTNDQNRMWKREDSRDTLQTSCLRHAHYGVWLEPSSSDCCSSAYAAHTTSAQSIFPYKLSTRRKRCVHMLHHSR